jgi:asparagine synthase (glutamine-hydrolysing)
MCGILGGWSAEQLGPDAWQDGLARLRHRGPDDSGEFRAGPVFLGMRRLAIIDLPGGRQPLANEDGSVVVVFNGEVYNYRELIPELRGRGHHFRTESDTEVLVHLYEEDGPALCERLRGMFCFALWDARRRLLLLARDRFGKKPLYYCRTPSGGLLFASELKALRPLAAAAGLHLEVRPQGVYDYLSLCVVPQPETIYRDVHALPPGSWLCFDGQDLKTVSYWRLDFRAKSPMPYAKAVEQTRALVSESVRLRLRSDVPLGVFLSGGVDSSVVAYEAAQHVGGGLRTFTVAMGEAAFDESPVAARTARALGVQNTVLPLRVSPLAELRRLIRHYDQPYADSSAIPSLAVSRLAREHVTVVLNGDGGDELFAGYRRYWAAHHSHGLGGLLGRAVTAAAKVFSLVAPRRRSALGFGARYARGLGLRPGARYLVWTRDMLREEDKRRVWNGGRMRPTEDWIESVLPAGLSGLDTQLYGDIYIILLSDLLVKIDMATMAASLEGRSPLLDHTLAEFTARLPDSYRLRGWRLKALLKDAYRGRVPDEVLQGRKQGFEIPLRSWLRHDLNELVMDTLGAGSARVRDYLSGQFIDDLLQGKVLRDRNWAFTVYMLLVLELWLQECSDAAVPPAEAPAVPTWASL